MVVGQVSDNRFCLAICEELGFHLVAREVLEWEDGNAGARGRLQGGHRFLAGVAAEQSPLRDRQITSGWESLVGLLGQAARDYSPMPPDPSGARIW
jgi:hypothetical protein